MVTWKGAVASKAPSGTGLRIIVTEPAALFGEERMVERSVGVGEDGGFTLLLDDPAVRDPRSSLAVLAPTGEVLVRRPLSELAVGDGRLKAIELPEQPSAGAPAPEPAPAPSASTQRRVSGRLFASDQTSAGGRAVRLFGRDGQGQPIALLAVTTDASGYFAGTTDRGVYTAAWAEVGGATATSLPVRLEDGAVPRHLILVLPEGAAATPPGEAGCACDAPPPAAPDADELVRNSEAFTADLGGTCQDFTVPNRTLEEFNFFKIVRTTDPEIQGLTLDNGPRSAAVADRLFQATFDASTMLTKAVDPVVTTRALSLSSRTPAAGAAGQDGGQGVAFMRGNIGAAPAAAEPTTDPHLNFAELEATGVLSAARWELASDTGAAREAVTRAAGRISAEALHAVLADPDGFTPVKLMKLERRALLDEVRRYLDWRDQVDPGRAPVSSRNPVRWDRNPEFYQATTIAHGHLLTIKQVWRADGYSLGELIKSLPLAPGQKKQVAILDWDRTDSVARAESEDEAETLVAELSRERDINEIANAAFHENIKGGSEASTEAIGGGIGFAIGPLVIGGGGGASSASSTAWQDSSRNLDGQTLNQLRDDTSQGASAVRSQRSTVVQTIGQHERVGATTEVVANHNRCHAITIQYFEVLRHFAVHERIAAVRECLFIPLKMSPFTPERVLRWLTVLRNACRKRAFRRNFKSVVRLSSPATTPPDRAFADDPVETLSGTLRFRLSITRPKDPDEFNKLLVEQTEWRFLAAIVNVSPQALYERYRRNEAKRDQIYREEIAPEVARQYLESLTVSLVDRDGNLHPSGLDLTTLSRYSEDGVIEVALNDAGATPRLTRRDIVGVEVSTDFPLPEYSSAVLVSARLDYATERMSYWLYRSDAVLDDVLLSDPGYLSTAALTAVEERNQLKEERRRQRELVLHLNENLEYYHRAIWLGMDANRRYMLLDGFEAPNSTDGRSVASVVENRLIGVVGNALVMPLAPGFQLDPLIRERLAEGVKPEELLERLYTVEPVPSRRLSVPTKGVFAEAMMGRCDSCEVIEEDRFWRWKNYPLPDSPPPIAPLSTASRNAAGSDLSPTPFPDAIVKFQTVPEAPAPTAMAAALGLLGKNVFKDLTGLTENQKNAMAALTTALSSSEGFATEAFQLSLAEQSSRNLDKTLDQINEGRKAGFLSPEEASAATRDALLSALGSPKEAAKEATEVPAVEEAVKKAAASPGGSATISRSAGDTTETVAFTSGDGSDLTIGAGTVTTLTDLPPLFLPTPILLESSNNGGLIVSKDTRALADAEVLLKSPATLSDGTKVLLDLFTPAKTAGLLRADPADATKLQIKVPVRASFLALASAKGKPAAPPAGGKLPVVFVLHGQAAAWVPQPPFQVTGTLPNGRKILTGGIKSLPNHAGYDGLQKALADGRIVSFSIETNFANQIDAAIEMRARLLLDAMDALRTQAADPTSDFHDLLDFSNVGIVGHSRGGEAVTRVLELNAARPAAQQFEIKAVCSIAPTDFRGSTTSASGMAFSNDLSYLVVHGGLDGDVSGVRTPGDLDFGGTGMRIYDRAGAHRAILWIPSATHDRFNSVWPDTNEFPGGAVPAGALSRGDHEKLSKEYIAGFFRMVLDRDATLAPLFDNRKANALGTPVALSWRFGASENSIDTFQGARAGRTLPGAGATVEALAGLTPPAAAAPADRQLHTPHMTTTYVLKLAGLGAPAALKEAFAPAMDVSAFDLLTFRLGAMYPKTAKQSDVDAVKPPDFTVTLEDGSGNKNPMGAAAILKDLANGWAKPKIKTVNGTDATQMVMQTIAVDLAKLRAPFLPAASTVHAVNLAQIAALTIEFQPAGGASEYWVDDICFVKR